MRVSIIQNCFKPDKAKTPDILVTGQIVDLPDDQAKTLITKGAAVKFEGMMEEKSEEAQKEKPKKSEKPKADK